MSVKVRSAEPGDGSIGKGQGKLPAAATGKRIFLRTFGCQMNERDSEMLSVLLERHGYALAERENSADAVILNTCSVRGKAEDKAIGKLRLLIARRKSRGCVIGAVGCMAQRLQDKLFELVPGLDIALGTFQMRRLPQALDLVYAGKGPVFDAAVCRDKLYDGKTHLAGGISAFVNILFGCNRRCAYCVVPDVRGAEWSRPARDILEEARLLTDGGVREITLLGQSIMEYGRANPVWDGQAAPSAFNEPLPRLLEALNAIPALRRIRFTSGHPSGCSVELAQAFRALPKVCEHLHLPLQSASNRILKLMRRGYDADQYRAAVRRLKEAAPQVAITTDIIVGFPSETEADFEATRAFMDEIGFDNAFIFKYNPRPGTVAAKMKDDVDEDEKLRRNHVLLADQARRSSRLHEAWVGRTVEVLVEGSSRRVAGRTVGRTRQNILTVFEQAECARPGDLINVVVEKATAQTLYAKLKTTKDNQKICLRI